MYNYRPIGIHASKMLAEEEKEERKFLNPVINGYWTDANNQSIKRARVEDTVKFHIETENIKDPEGKKIKVQLKEYDTPVPIIIMGIPILELRPFDDEINIVTVDKNLVEKVVNEVVLDKNGKAEISITLTRNLNKLIADNELGKLEFYFKCDYENSSFMLPKTKRDYLSVVLSEKEIYVKPTTDGDSFPEFLSTTGEIFKFYVSETEPGKISNIRTTKFSVNKTLKYAHEINELIKEVHIDRVNLKTGEGNNVKKYIEIAQDSFFSNATIKPQDGYPEPYFSNLSYEARKITVSGIKKPLDYIKDLKNLTHEFLRKSLNFIDYVDIVKIFMNENKDISSILSLFGGMYSPLAFASKFIVDYQLKQINETISEWEKVGFANAKYKGLDAVKEFMKLPIAKGDYGYELLSITEELYLKLMKGEIDKYNSLISENEKIKNSMSSANYDKATTYHIILKSVLDDERKDKIYLIETVIH